MPRRYGYRSGFVVGAKVRVGVSEGVLTEGPCIDGNGKRYWWVEFDATSVKAALANTIAALRGSQPNNTLPQLEEGLVLI